MAYIGSTPTSQNFTSGTDYFSGTGSQTAYTLTRTVNSVNDIEVVINNVVQQPSTAYTLSGTTITFTSAPSSGTNNIYVRYLATNMQSFTVPANSITRSQLDSNLQAGFQGRNKIINGHMVVDQRNAGASVSNTTSNFYTLDRWACFGSQSSKFTVQQNAGSVAPPVGFTNYIGCTSSSAYSIGSGDYFQINQPIEAFNTADLGWGTANAKTVTLSFWVYSSLTGTFGGAFRNNSVNYCYPFSYTINSTNTWEYKTITVVGPTTGTWATGNSSGVLLNFSLGMGSTYSGTAGAWLSGNYASATGATSVVGTSGATWYLTGVQLEEGTTATSFEREAYSVTLQKCQRYYQRQDVTADNTYFSIGQAYATNGAITPIYFSGGVMRTAPTITLGTAGTSAGQLFPSKSDSNPPSTVGTLSAITSTIQHFVINATGWTSAFTAGNGSGFIAKGPCNVYQASAEL